MVSACFARRSARLRGRVDHLARGRGPLNYLDEASLASDSMVSRGAANEAPRLAGTKVVVGGSRRSAQRCPRGMRWAASLESTAHRPKRGEDEPFKAPCRHRRKRDGDDPLAGRVEEETLGW